jgi:acyl-CoA thioester hydrolase
MGPFRSPRAPSGKGEPLWQAVLMDTPSADTASFHPVVSVEIPVAWGDMDAFGHVNNTVFFRWCETARIACFEATGINARMKSDRIGPILAQASLQFRRPVTFPDTIRAEAAVARVGNTSFVLAYRLSSLSRGTVVGDGESAVVMMDYGRSQKVSIDDKLRATLLKLVG